MKRALRRWLPVAELMLGLSLMLMAMGCASMTPEQRDKADKAKVAATAAAERLAKVEADVKAHVAEYEAIKARVDAGESLPAAVVARYAELSGLVRQDVQTWRELKAAYDDAREAAEQASAAGVPWYEMIPWTALATLILGAAGTYFPIARPATLAAQAAIRGVAELQAADPAAGAAAKGSILDASRALGVEATLDALVQRYDPPRT